MATPVMMPKVGISVESCRVRKERYRLSGLDE